MVVFISLLSTFCLDQIWTDNAIVHISQAAAKGLSQLASNNWICQNIGDPVVFCLSQTSDFQCLSFSGTNSAPSILCQTP